MRGSEGTRHAIKQCALRAFVREGYAAANVREIASQAAISPSVLYYYYPSKEELYTAVIYEALVDLFSKLRAGVDFGPHRPLVEIITDLLAVRAPGHLSDDELRLYRISILEWLGHRGDTALMRMLRDMIAERRTLFVAGIARRAAAGTASPATVADMVYKYMEFETISMLFGVTPFDRARVRQELRIILGDLSDATRSE